MGTQTLTFRNMMPDDVAACVELDDKCFGNEAWDGDFFMDEIHNPRAAYIVGEVDGKIVACAGIDIFLDEAEMTTFAIAPNFQGRGFGKRLLTEIINVARNFGATSMIFEVSPSNIPAIHIYQTFGFRKIGRIRHYYASGEDALTMRGDI